MEKSYPSLNILLNYVPSNESNEIQEQIEIYKKMEKTALQYYFDELENVYSNGYYYLGGQLEMTIDDEITMEKINNVREMIEQKMKKNTEMHESYEDMSISIFLLNQIEELVKCYSKINKIEESPQKNKKQRING